MAGYGGVCNGSRSWWNGLKYCFLRWTRHPWITACSFFHRQRLGGNFISFRRQIPKDGRVAFAMVLDPGDMVWHIVSCNASVSIELLDAHFLTKHDSMETFFSISTFGWLDLPQHSFIFPSYQTLVLQPIDATISLFKSSLIVANLHYGHHFLYSLHRPLLPAPMFQPFIFL